jgi:hypothetical protein
MACTPIGHPEGIWFYTQFAVRQPMEVMMPPYQVQFLGGIADNFLFKVLVGRKHVQQVPQVRASRTQAQLPGRKA